MINKIALGGGCHWCTEAIFQSLIGVERVEQGFIAATGEASSFSEAVIVHFRPETISLKVLIEIHLYTHKSTSDHAMRSKYRSAIYTFSKAQRMMAEELLTELQSEFEKELVTRVYTFNGFRRSDSQFKNYYLKDPSKPFCENYILPKLQLLRNKYSDKVKAGSNQKVS